MVLSFETVQHNLLFYISCSDSLPQVCVFFGGLAIAKDEQVLKNNCPHIVVGTPGRILALIRSKKLPLKNLKHFVLDECDKMLEQLGECATWICLLLRIYFNSIVFLTYLFNRSFPRHEARRAGDIPGDAAREASDDVLCDPLQGDPPSLQEVHARREFRTCASSTTWLSLVAHCQSHGPVSHTARDP